MKSFLLSLSLALVLPAPASPVAVCPTTTLDNIIGTTCTVDGDFNYTFNSYSSNLVPASSITFSLISPDGFTLTGPWATTSTTIDVSYSFTVTATGGGDGDLLDEWFFAPNVFPEYDGSISAEQITTSGTPCFVSPPPVIPCHLGGESSATFQANLIVQEGAVPASINYISEFSNDDAPEPATVCLVALPLLFLARRFRANAR